MSDSCHPMDYIAFQAPLSIELSRQEYWSGLPFPSPGPSSIFNKPPPSASGNHQSIYCIYEFRVCLFFVLDFTCKWDHIILSWSHLFVLAQCPQGLSMLLQMAGFPLFYGWKILPCISIHISFIHSSPGWHVVCFHFLAVINNAAVNLGVQIPFCVKFPMVKYPEVKLVDHMAVLFLNF